VGDGKRESDEVFVGYPRERVSLSFFFVLYFSCSRFPFVPSSRRPFVPADHWLVTAQLDMNSFVEAAVYAFHIYFNSFSPP